jgi:hypothetical protein
MAPIDSVLEAALAKVAPLDPADALHALVRQGLDRLPLPGSGATLARWRVLAAVAGRNLSLAKLYEGHTDALAVLCEIGARAPLPEQAVWGMWAAEAPQVRVEIDADDGSGVRLHGLKRWCSGAAHVTHGLLTAWWTDGRGPQLVQVAMDQAGVSVDADAWLAVGMADSASLDIRFSHARGLLLGEPGDYLTRPGFWQGGAGIAACWYGGAHSMARSLHLALRDGRDLSTTAAAFQLAALGRVDTAMATVAAHLRETARWIDEHPAADAREPALRARLICEAAVTRVIDEACRALGPGPLCRDAHVARLVADLPVFVRQSHGDRDLAALGGCVAATEHDPWRL